MPSLPPLLTKPPTLPAFLSLLQICNSTPQFLQIHSQLLRTHFFYHPIASSKLLQSLTTSSHPNLHYAHNLFDQIPQPTTFHFNTLFRAFANSPNPSPSIDLFRRMLCSQFSEPNSYTYTFLLKSIGRLSVSGFVVGQQLHCFMLKVACDCNVFVINGLISMYCACSCVELGKQIFDGRPDFRDEVSYNCMISGYIECGLVDRARCVFEDMPERGIISWNAMINGYASHGNINAARELFEKMPDRNVETWNTLIAGYAKCGQLDMALSLFKEMPIKNVVSWSAMISACAQSDQPSEALALFDMMEDKIRPNWAAIVSVLSACSQLGVLDKGMKIHYYIERNKMKLDPITATALIDMYSKCGCIAKAIESFNKLVTKDVFTWTAMINGLAVNGHGPMALELFDRMLLEGVKPNEVTFVGVLLACGHGGLVGLAKHYFESMRLVYGLEPQNEHYGCMVDALGRAGHLEEAIELVEAKSCPMLWGTVLGACWIHGNLGVAEFAGERLIELEPNDGGHYVLLSNIYAKGGKWEKARMVRMAMRDKRLRKAPGRSTIEIGGVVHGFFVGGSSHPSSSEIYHKLDEVSSRLRLIGYEPNTKPVLFDLEEEEKEHAVIYHSEKLAIAFGLIGVESKAAIRVVKNLRVCQDCHTFAKLVSKIYDREIILRDRSVFHYFREGSCSCRDYW